MTAIERRLAVLGSPVLRDVLRGVEKEGLRVRPDGTLAATAHPAALGSALTHPHITTDFSEAQLELITGVHPTADACVAELAALHEVVLRHIGNELVWCASMPCRLPADEAIPLGEYGSSNLGRLKNVYRRGLSRRYGRRMQTISGIHYNFSLPEAAWPLLQAFDGDAGPAGLYQDRAYFALIRNFRRHSWLLLLLLGASPAVCGTFVRDRAHELQRWETGTYIAPFGTSLRMGPLGYQSDAQAALCVSFNDLAGYANALHRALTEDYPPYAAIGLRDGDEYLQLATTLLQIENEFYGTIRPKRRIRRGERPLAALGSRGVEYVEVRCIDIDPYQPVGIAASAMRLLDVFLLHCLLAESPPDSPAEIAAMSRNQHRVAARGRDPEIRLERAGEHLSPVAWGRELLDGLAPIAAAFDDAHGGCDYRDAVEAARLQLDDLAALPSARVLHDVDREFERSYPAFALAQSEQHCETLRGRIMPADEAARYDRMAAESLEAQAAIEAGDTLSFEDFRAAYLEQPLLGGVHLRGPD